MGLKLLYPTGNPNGRLPVDSAATFEAGMVAQISSTGTVVAATTLPIGLIDDNKTTAFSAPVIAEQYTCLVAGASTVTLNHANITTASYRVQKVSAAGVISASLTEGGFGVGDFTFNATNGIVTVTAGGAIAVEPAYIDTTGGGVPDAIYILVSYSYAIPGVQGVDTTLASGLVTVWTTPGEYGVNVYDTSVVYDLAGGNNQILVVGTGAGGTTAGVITTHAKLAAGKQIGYVTKVPTFANPWLHFQASFAGPLTWAS